MFDFLKPRTELRTIDPSAFGDAWGDMRGAETWSGSVVNNDTAIRTLAVYGCARFIADGISTLPVDVYRRDGDARIEVTKPTWLLQPTPELDTVAWLGQLLTSLLLAGNAYVFKTRDPGTGGFKELRPLDPSKVQVRREAGRKVFFVEGKTFTSFDIMHIPGLMWPGADIGLSPVEMARQTIGAGMSAEEYAARFFGQGATTAGIIENPNAMPPEGPGSPGALAKMFARLHSGKSKAHLPAVLEGGATWKATGITNEQAQFLQTRQFTAAQIASMMFLIDPTEFGMSMDKGSSITYANLEQRTARKVTVTYLPWIVRIENAVSELLAKPRYMKLNVKGMLRGDTLTRFQTYNAAEVINASAVARGDKPVMLTEEMREFEDMAPLVDVPTPPAAPAAAAPVTNNNFTLPDNYIDNRTFIDAPSHISVPESQPPIVNVDNRSTYQQGAFSLFAEVDARTNLQQEPPVVNNHIAAPSSSRRVVYDEKGRVSHLVEE